MGLRKTEGGHGQADREGDMQTATLAAESRDPKHGRSPIYLNFFSLDLANDPDFRHIAAGPTTKQADI
jgi:hypothetical protein